MDKLAGGFVVCTSHNLSLAFQDRCEKLISGIDDEQGTRNRQCLQSIITTSAMINCATFQQNFRICPSLDKRYVDAYMACRLQDVRPPIHSLPPALQAPSPSLFLPSSLRPSPPSLPPSPPLPPHLPLSLPQSPLSPSLPASSLTLPPSFASGGSLFCMSTSSGPLSI